jgi:hypothetical protein
MVLNFAFGEGRRIVCDVFYCDYEVVARSSVFEEPFFGDEAS